MFEPGSTFKIVAFAAKGRVSFGFDQFPLEDGKWKFAQMTIMTTKGPAFAQR